MDKILEMAEGVLGHFALVFVGELYLNRVAFPRYNDPQDRERKQRQKNK